MRILHLGKYFPPVAGGMERFLADLVGAQQRAGHEVTVLVHEHKGAARGTDPPWLLRCPVWLKLIFAPISPLYVLWLRRAVRRHRPDVVHIHMPNLSPFWGLMLPSVRRLPWIIHWHSDVVASSHKVWLRMAYPWYHIFERAMLERAEAVVVTSPQYLRASEPLHPWKQKCHVIPLGVAPERLPDVAASEGDAFWQRDGLRLLAAGRLTYYKGFETLVRAVIPLTHHQLLIVGEGEERPQLARLLEEAGSPAHIRLLGEVNDAALCRLMASCDVFCLPSRERTEAFGLVLVEAMRYAKPLLASDLQGSGVAWVARHGQNAILVPMENVEAWRKELAWLDAHPARRQMLGRLGAERYRRELSIDNVVQRLDELYGLVLRMRMTDAEWTPADDDLGPPSEGGLEEPRLVPSARLLVVIPALNEAECIGDVIRQVRQHPEVDVLVIDDGSTDDTANIAALEGATVMRAPLWQGAWGAMQTGIRYAVRNDYSAVVTMDADGQHEPGYLPQLMEAARDADVVIASCPSRGSRMRQIAWSYFRLLTGFNFDDLTSGFRYYNARACRLLAAEEATLLDYQDVGVLLLLSRAHLRIAEISVAMNPRKSGASRVFSSWWTVGRYMAETTLLCLARWNRPLRQPR